MIRIDEADENFRLLLYSFDKSWSPLENWLKKIGLERLPYYSVLVDIHSDINYTIHCGGHPLFAALKKLN